MWRRLLRFVGVAFAVFGLVVVGVVADGWVAFGKKAEGARAERIRRSPQWHDGHFANPQPMFMDPASVTALLSWSPVASPRPEAPVAAVAISAQTLARPPSSGLRVTWFGHASTLVEIDGKRVLTDPAFGERASPFDWIGPKRWFPAAAIDALGVVDAIIVSHDHHDHLQYASVRLLRDKPVTWFVPLGVGAHLEYWGVPAERIVELDWWQSGTLRGKNGAADIDIVCVPARHASGRHLLDQGATLWASWALKGPQHRVFFSGDTGLHDAMSEIGERHGPFDLTMIEVGQYNPTWPDWHIGPEQAVKAHQRLRGKVLLPIHWALWSLAPHGWTEPGERALTAASSSSVMLALPRPGAPFEPTHMTTTPMKWWPEEPWQRGEEAPIVSTVAGDPAVRMR